MPQKTVITGHLQLTQYVVVTSVGKEPENCPGIKGPPYLEESLNRKFGQLYLGLYQGCGVGVGRNFRWSRSRSQKEFFGGIRVGKNVPTPTLTPV
jgi:hypothetical protein